MCIHWPVHPSVHAFEKSVHHHHQWWFIIIIIIVIIIIIISALQLFLAWWEPPLLVWMSWCLMEWLLEGVIKWDSSLTLIFWKTPIFIDIHESVTNRWMEWQTDGRTDPLIEMQGRVLSGYDHLTFWDSLLEIDLTTIQMMPQKAFKRKNPMLIFLDFWNIFRYQLRDIAHRRTKFGGLYSKLEGPKQLSVYE